MIFISRQFYINFIERNLKKQMSFLHSYHLTFNKLSKFIDHTIKLKLLSNNVLTFIFFTFYFKNRYIILLIVWKIKKLIDKNSEFIFNLSNALDDTSNSS